MKKNEAIELEKDTENVICPFFKGIRGSTIKCEGLMPETASATVFEKRGALRQHKNAYCDTFDYVKCQLCAVLLKKYDKPTKL